MDPMQLASVAYEKVQSVSTDILVMVTIMVLLVAVSLLVGKGKALSVLLAIPFGALLVKTLFDLPYLSSFNERVVQGVSMRIITYIAMTGVVFLVLRRHIHGDFATASRSKVLQVGLLAVSSWGLFISLGRHTAGADVLFGRSVVSDFLFGSSISSVAWLIIPIAALYVVRKV